MEELLACRVCLATDTKLFNMYKYRLISAYEVVTGTQVTPSDCLPRQVCTFCSSLLIKCATFQQRCRNSQELLNYAMLQQHLITTDYIRNVNRETHNLTHPYTHQTILSDAFVTYQELDDIKLEQKDDFDADDTQIKYESTNDSDEEPLAKKKVKKRKKVLKEDFNDIDSCKEVIEDVEVITLTKEQQIREIEERKESINYTTCFYKCDLCYKGFVSEGTFKNHMARHDPASGPSVCDICHTRWPDARSLRAHLLATHEKKYVCKRCNHVSKSGYKAREHSKWHDGFTYVCDICGASFSKSTSRLTHIRLHHPSNFSCDICGESFIGEYGLKVHKNKSHKNEKPKIKCETHCVLCGVQFKTSEALDRHVLNICDDNNKRPCVYCGDNFITQELLTEHIKVHQKDESVKCTECNRKFANSKTCAVHYQRVHLGLKRKRQRGCRDADSAVCEICGRTCTSKTTLGYHMRIHTGEKPYQCTACPKRFSIYQRLQIHIRTHTGERPYKCTHCPKAFKHKAALNRHDRVHTGAKPYACQHCGKAFSQSNSLKMHVRTVHLKIPAPYRASRKQPRMDVE